MDNKYVASIRNTAIDAFKDIASLERDLDRLKEQLDDKEIGINGYDESVKPKKQAIWDRRQNAKEAVYSIMQQYNSAVDKWEEPSWDKMPDDINLLAVMDLSELELTGLSKKHWNNPTMQKAIKKKAKESGFDFWATDAPTGEQKKVAFKKLAGNIAKFIDDKEPVNTPFHKSMYIKDDAFWAEMLNEAAELNDSGECS